jgi:CDP-glucose 4,6-dehydratase
MEMNLEFWKNRRVLVTGHTGFKGSWLSLWLQSLGADVIGYSLSPPTEPNLFDLAGVQNGIVSIFGDVTVLNHLRRSVREHQPEIVFHLAAQALVRRSYIDPIGTYATNVQGTVNVLEAIREVSSIKAAVIITSDKCYENREDSRAYRETDRLGGSDPYSNSKACAEFVTAAYSKSFFTGAGGRITVGVATARAGNVIGGGDWATDRLIPDVMRATLTGGELLIRNPNAVRPWQHVLEPLSGYLLLAERVYEDPARFSQSWNFGPDESENVPVSEVLERVRKLWGTDLSWRLDESSQPHEAKYLRLDCTKAKAELGWKPRVNLDSALLATVKWYKAFQSHQDVRSLVLEQIHSYQKQIDLRETSLK